MHIILDFIFCIILPVFFIGKIDFYFDDKTYNGLKLADFSDNIRYYTRASRMAGFFISLILSNFCGYIYPSGSIERYLVPQMAIVVIYYILSILIMKYFASKEQKSINADKKEDKGTEIIDDLAKKSSSDLFFNEKTS